MAKMIILDGAMGTMLQNSGLKSGQKPELFAFEKPDVVQAVHQSYVQAGSKVIYANTFGANRHKLEGTGYTVEQVIKHNISIAKKAAQNKAKVALDIGPIGELMQPLGQLSFDQAYDIFKEMIIAGANSGADLIVLETMTDLYEVKAAVLAAKENSNLPIWVTMSFEQNGRTFTGTTVPAMALTLEGLGVDAIGINCSLGPQEILPLMQELSQWTKLPLIAKPNAGLPDPKTGSYMITPKQFSQQMKGFWDIGVNIVGGCCGTSPAFIQALADIRESGKAKAKKTFNGVCSSSNAVPFNGIRVIGERINPTGKKRLQQALKEHDMNYVMRLALEQAEAGADILDINVGLPGLDEVSLMKDVVQAVQSVVNLPLQIDSSNPKAIEAGLRYANGKAIVNSVNAEDNKLEAILPIVKKYGSCIVGLALSKDIPTTANQRFDNASYILKRAQEFGIAKENVIIDCLTLTVSAQQEQALQTLKAVKMVHDKLKLHQTLGVSNISFGLPNRSLITCAFLTQAINCGLDLPIINPNSIEIMNTIASCKVLSTQDKDCEAFIKRMTFQQETEQKVQNKSLTELTIDQAILKGLGDETEKLTKQLLESKTELDVINQDLIPALDIVGQKYEKQELFLPQLINAANAACKGFDLIRTRIANKGGDSISKGKIVMATVEGDIHDIGKNIVKVVLQNYGYQVIDLGKDVPVQTVVDAVLENDVKLVGLSALMTTTVEAMKRTIEAIRATGHDCKIFVGGAVLTSEYAKLIGADYYTKDAKASADVAKEVLG